MVLPPYSANLMFKMLNDDATMDTIIKLIKNPAKGGTPNTREYIDFFRKYKDIRNASSLNDRLKIDDNDLYQEWLKERSENPSQRKEIKNRVFNNFIKMKTVLLSKTERSGAPALAEFIMGDVSQSEGAEAAKKWFSTITTELNRLPKAERKIRDMRKNLPKNQEGFYGKLVRYLPEVGEPTVAQFENNKKPIYSYSLAKIYLAIPDAKGVPKVSGWAGSVSDNPQHQQGIYVFKKIFSNKESKKYKFAAPDNEFREVINKIKKLKLEVEYDENTGIVKEPSLLTRLLLGKAIGEDKLEEILSASSRDITVVGTLTDEMMERYFRILATAGQQKVKGPHILVMPRFKGQKLRNVIYKKQSFQVQTIPFVKRLLSEPATDRIFENSAQSIQITPALSEDSFKVQWKTKNPEENVDSELYEQDFRKYLTVFRLPEDILAVAEELGVAFAKERKEEIRNLTLIDGAYHALTTKEMELVSFIIEEIQDELSTQFKDADIDRDERDKYLVNIGIAQEGVSTEKTLKAAINNIISGRTSISSKLLDNTMPNKYLTGNRIGLEDAFIITEFLLYRINRTGTRSQVAKIDTLLQKQGEGLSVDNKTLEQAVEALVRLMQKELIDFNRQFRVELIKHIGDRLRNKEKNIAMFSGRTFSDLIKAGILIEGE
tara:strand:- start:1495 stop:3477 length:1983 start_codon:yes stop_codon:yes gene_type:complete